MPIRVVLMINFRNVIFLGGGSEFYDVIFVDLILCAMGVEGSQQFIIIV